MTYGRVRERGDKTDQNYRILRFLENRTFYLFTVPVE